MLDSGYIFIAELIGLTDELEVCVRERTEGIPRHLARGARRTEWPFTGPGKIAEEQVRDVGADHEVCLEHVRFGMSFQHPVGELAL